MRPLLDFFVITELGCIGRWPISDRCSSSKTGLPISPSKPTHELGYGIRISGARSILAYLLSLIHPFNNLFHSCTLLSNPWLFLHLLWRCEIGGR